MKAIGLLIAIIATVKAADPTCTRGLVSSNNADVCCPKYCGVCDQGDCASRPGGIWECCSWGVRQKPACTNAEAPCYMVPNSPTVAMNVGTTASVIRPSTISIFPGDTNIWSKFSQLGAWPMCILQYQDVRFLSFPYLKTFLDQGLQVQLTIEFWDYGPNLWSLSGGSRDYELTQFFKQVKLDGRHVTVRILHEMNGTWYPWSMYGRNSNSLAAYLAAFRRIVTTIRNTGANVSIQQAYNSMTVGGSDSFESMYAGDQYVDEVVVSAYNFACIVGAPSKTIDQIIMPWYLSMNRINKKRLGIAEMSSTGGCGVDKPGWIRDAWKRLASDFPRIQTVTWFFINKGHEDLDVNNWNEANAFTTGYYNWHSITQSWTQGDLPSFDATESQKLELEQADADYKAALLEKNLVHEEVVKHEVLPADVMQESGPRPEAYEGPPHMNMGP